MSSHILTRFRAYFQRKFQWFCKVIHCFGMPVAGKNNENPWICRWKYGLERVKMCDLINYKINMMYTIGNNVGIEWRSWLRSLKIILLRETSKISVFSGHIHHCRVSYSKWSMLCMHPGARISEGAAVIGPLIDFPWDSDNIQIC